MHLVALQDLMTIIRHGGFAPASRATGTPKSTLSRRVRALEEELGVRLVERTSRTFRLTAEGTALCERASRAFAELDDAERTLRSLDAHPRGPLRIAVPYVFGHLFMGRLSAEYRSAYPDVDLEVVFADRPVDVVREGFDAAIVINASDTADLICRRFARDRLVFVAPRKLLNQRTKARATSETPWPTIVYEPLPLRAAWPLVEGGRRFVAIPAPVLLLRSKLVMRDAALAGAGAALLPRGLVEADLASGRLVRVGYLENSDTVVSIVHPSRRLVSGRLRAFIELLVRTFAMDA
ncbi:LysR family transcriptional regulator [Pendulispora albinea]|uniref:LysR substrate-binding domain-containing protein n=1 Tax=Pendulispora albinea TaxID=2741071 RepID=A0ABZ2LVZ0_9BACT